MRAYSVSGSKFIHSAQIIVLDTLMYLIIILFVYQAHHFKHRLHHAR